MNYRTKCILALILLMYCNFVPYDSTKSVEEYTNEELKLFLAMSGNQEFRLEVEEYYPFEEVENIDLLYLLNRAQDRSVRLKAFEYLDFEIIDDWYLTHLYFNSPDEEVIQKANESLLIRGL